MKEKQKSGYLCIDYRCNEKCRYCPCGKEEMEEGAVLPFQIAAHMLQDMKKQGVTSVTISGGEPTLHPELLNILSFVLEHFQSATLLTNAERFSQQAFFDRFCEVARTDGLRIITTLHDHEASRHEAANGTPGSFRRTVDGLKRLVKAGYEVIVKHCITKENYRRLADFYRFIREIFPDRTEVQLCGIDYEGVPEERLAAEMLPFPALKPFLEELFEEHRKDCEQGRRRKISIINIPLCASDPCYWELYYSFHTMIHYSFYTDPAKKEIVSGRDNAAAAGRVCRKCLAVDICPGTYLSAFRFFGDQIVSPVTG